MLTAIDSRWQQFISAMTRGDVESLSVCLPRLRLLPGPKVATGASRMLNGIARRI
jgi:hypothetical protein